MKKSIIKVIVAIMGSALLAVIVSLKTDPGSPPQNPAKYISHAVLPYDSPLDAVKWTGGFWQERMQKLREIYLPGVLDGSFMSTENGSTYRNFLRATGMEQGEAIGSSWGDGDCYFLLETISRLLKYSPDTYLRDKLNYWIPIIASVQRPDGLLDTWTILNKEGSTQQYNLAHLYKSATTHYRATDDDTLLNIADRYLSYYIANNIGITHQMAFACGLRYKRTGETTYLNKLSNFYSPTKQSSTFGPPFRVAQEVYGHNTQAFHELNGATLLYEITGEEALLDALNRLAGNLLEKKSYITGAVASINTGLRPVIIINNVTYPETEISEAVGQPFDLPLDKAYCESCGQCLFMEFFYRMYRLTGNTTYMDAAERMLYNTTLGCVDLDHANFFYSNPQRQGSDSWRALPSGNEHWTRTKYTWKRMYLEKSACCRPKVLRAIAMTPEIAYNINDDGLWINLYGKNSLRIKLSSGDSLFCEQTSDYPWDGKFKLDLTRVDKQDPFSIFIRIPGWVDTLVTIKLNGVTLPEPATPGTSYRLQRKWNTGDRLEWEFPMPVKTMAANGAVSEVQGSVAVMRGPLLYCLEDQDILAGSNIEKYYMTGDVSLNPVTSQELGGVVKLSGSLVYSTSTIPPYNTSEQILPDKGLYQPIALEDSIITDPVDQKIPVSLIPFYARLNRTSEYFKVWITVYNRTNTRANKVTDNNAGLYIYPNPVSERFFFRENTNKEIFSVKLYSSAGSLIREYTGPSASGGIPVNDIDPGMYMIQLRFKDGSNMQQKIIKNQP